MMPAKMKKMYFWTKSLSPTTMAVRPGSSAPRSRKIFAKTGMTFQSRKMATVMAKMTMATG